MNTSGQKSALHRGQILVDALDPGRKVKLLERARVRRGALLSIYAVQLHVTELGIRKELAAAEQCRANAGAEGQHDHGTGAVATRAPAHLGQTGRVGVVEKQHRPGQFARREPRCSRTDPRPIDVGRRVGDAVLHDAGKGDADALSRRG